jgi:hypothetical protein
MNLIINLYKKKLMKMEINMMKKIVCLVLEINHKIIKFLGKTLFIRCWKIESIVIKPNGITTYSEWP